MTTITLIFPFSSIKKRLRLVKLYRVLEKLNISVEIYHWERVKNEALEDIDFNFTHKTTLLKGGGNQTANLKYWYPLWMMMVFIKVLMAGKGKIHYCLGFESAFPVYCAGKIISASYIFDDADRFSLLVNYPAPLLKLIQVLEEKVSRDSVLNLVPGLSRYSFRNQKQEVLRNTPDRVMYEESKIYEIDKNRYEGKFVVYVNGWLNDSRGLGVLNRLATSLCESKDDVSSKIKFLVAGRVDGESASMFIKHPNVEYLGILPPVQSLIMYRYSDLIFTYYDPAVPINVFAESNKWGDAIAYGVPVVVNAEVKSADFLRERSACISLSYHDIVGLEAALLNVCTHDDVFQSMKSGMMTLGSDFEYFDEHLEKLIRLHLLAERA